MCVYFRLPIPLIADIVSFFTIVDRLLTALQRNITKQLAHSTPILRPFDLSNRA